MAAVPQCFCKLLTMPVLGSPECEWLLCLVFVFSLLIMPVFASSESEWLLCYAAF